MHTAAVLGAAIVLTAFHILASNRSPKYWYLGGVVPLLWLGVNAFLFFNGLLHFREDWKMLTFPTLILLLIWLKGHQNASKRELRKMSAKDMNG